MAVKIRVQNPNETPIDYNGIALDLQVNGQPLAAGVSDQQGNIGRFDEAVIVVPVSVTAFSFLRQAYGWASAIRCKGYPMYCAANWQAGGWAPSASPTKARWICRRLQALAGNQPQRLLLAAAIILLTSLRTMLAYSGGDMLQARHAPTRPICPCAVAFGNQPGRFALALPRLLCHISNNRAFSASICARSSKLLLARLKLMKVPAC
ncbi:hypothetical protein PisoF_00012 [Pseudomonas sp. IsoF]|nr:hypothetical protein PisoF_00012 [Pseudomonas sp. IsoF]